MVFNSLVPAQSNLQQSGHGLLRNLTSAKEVSQPEKRLHKFQSTLPRLPVPTLEETLKKFLETAKPLLTKEEFDRASRLAAEFPERGGKKLQELLLERARTAKNHWLEDWWNIYAYLEYRDPICIWVNYCFVLKDEVYSFSQSDNRQTSRAARMVSSALKFKHLVDTEQLEPDMIRNKTPISSDQYPYLFNACRIPREKRDEVLSYPGARHIIVARSNRFYTVNVLDENGNPYDPAFIEAELLKVIEIDSKDKSSTPPVGIFTAEQRDQWATIYKELEADPQNKETLHQIQSSILVVCLDDKSPEKLNELSEVLLHSDAKNRWFEKQIQIIVFENGKAGFNYEHARIDGLTTIRLTDYIFDQSQKIVMGERVTSQIPLPSKLQWNLNGSLLKHLEQSSKNVKSLIDDNATEVIEFCAFGANSLKAKGCSPDSFVQLAFQLAHYRLNQHLTPTYESGSTKEFLNGRTEVVRSATAAALEFCRNMERNSNATLAQKKQLLQQALTAHNEYMKLAKVGKGVDRHILGLKLIAAEAGLELPDFLKDPSISKTSHWRLSTSNCGSPNLRAFGFGPVVPDGYGLGYMIHDSAININVTSKRSSSTTSARQLAHCIELALLEMHHTISDIQCKL